MFIMCIFTGRTFSSYWWTPEVRYRGVIGWFCLYYSVGITLSSTSHGENWKCAQHAGRSFWSSITGMLHPIDNICLVFLFDLHSWFVEWVRPCQLPFTQVMNLTHEMLGNIRLNGWIWPSHLTSIVLVYISTTCSYIYAAHFTTIQFQMT